MRKTVNTAQPVHSRWNRRCDAIRRRNWWECNDMFQGNFGCSVKYKLCPTDPSGAAQEFSMNVVTFLEKATIHMLLRTETFSSILSTNWATIWSFRNSVCESQTTTHSGMWQTVRACRFYETCQCCCRSSQRRSDSRQAHKESEQLQAVEWWNQRTRRKQD